MLSHLYVGYCTGFRNYLSEKYQSSKAIKQKRRKLAREEAKASKCKNIKVCLYDDEKPNFSLKRTSDAFRQLMFFSTSTMNPSSSRADETPGSRNDIEFSYEGAPCSQVPSVIVCDDVEDANGIDDNDIIKLNDFAFDSAEFSTRSSFSFESSSFTFKRSTVPSRDV